MEVVQPVLRLRGFLLNADIRLFFLRLRMHLVDSYFLLIKPLGGVIYVR